MEDVFDFVFVSFVVILAIFGIFAIVTIPVYVIDRWTCNSYEIATSKPTKYIGFMCYVKDKNIWYSQEEYKHRLITKGEMK